MRDVVGATFGNPCVPWHRLSDFQLVTLKLIAAQLLRGSRRRVVLSSRLTDALSRLTLMCCTILADTTSRTLWRSE